MDEKREAGDKPPASLKLSWKDYIHIDDVGARTLGFWGPYPFAASSVASDDG